MVNVLLALLATILLLAPPFAQLAMIPDVLSALVLEPEHVLNVRKITTEVLLVLPVLLVNSPLLDQLPPLIANPVTMPQTVPLVLAKLLENVLCVMTVMLCLVESALNAVIPTVTSALVLELDNVTLALPAIP